MVSRNSVGALCLSLWIAAALSNGGVYGQDETPVAQSLGNEATTSEASKIIDFARDVQPILAAKCVHCHGPEEAKNDFRVDDAETLLAYVEPGDLQGSSLWSDYLTTEDDDLRMPPPSDDPTQQLTGSEFATLKLWIEEGADWSVEEQQVASTPAPASGPLVVRAWQFQGLFHPATVHFPIALLLVSSAFVLFSCFYKTVEPVAFHCLWIGALGSLVAAATGWSYAVHEGYGSSFSFDLQGSAIDRHRWLGIAVAGLAFLLLPMAFYVRRTGDLGMRLMWLLGSLFMVGAVSMAGYQGGELTYGEEHYEKEFKRLFPEFAQDVPTVPGDQQPVKPATDKVEQPIATTDDISPEPIAPESVATESTPVESSDEADKSESQETKASPESKSETQELPN